MENILDRFQKGRHRDTLRTKSRIGTIKQGLIQLRKIHDDGSHDSYSDGKTRIEIRLQDDALWLTQRQIAELYEKTSPITLNEHLKNIYNEGELEPDSTIRKFRIVAMDDERIKNPNYDNFCHSTKQITPGYP